jgi:hypothetical protein
LAGIKFSLLERKGSACPGVTLAGDYGLFF